VRRIVLTIMVKELRKIVREEVRRALLELVPAVDEGEQREIENPVLSALLEGVLAMFFRICLGGSSLR